MNDSRKAKPDSSQPTETYVKEIKKQKVNVEKTIEELSELENWLRQSSGVSVVPRRSSLTPESVSRHKQNVKEAIKDLTDLAGVASNSLSKGGRSKLNRESLTRHKDNLVSAINELTEFEEFLKKGELKPSPEKENKGQESDYVGHKKNVRDIILNLAALDATLEGMNKPDVGKNADKEPQAKMASRGSKDLEDILLKKRYVEEDVDFQLVEKKEESDKLYNWVEKNTERALYHIAILTLFASILTACACYMFAELPPDIYSTHILREIFLGRDEVIAKSGFQKPFSTQMVTPLPALILLMFLSLLYLVYLIQYPKQGKARKCLRYFLFCIFQCYLILCVVSYSLATAQVAGRLKAYFKRDQRGTLKGFHESGHTTILHGLDHAQEYLKCCGFHSRKEWSKIAYKTKRQSYNFSTDGWPLSCCDEKRSKIACYAPVHEKVTYIRPPKYKKSWEEAEKVTKKRLHSSTCFAKEKTLTSVVAGIVIVLIFIHLILSTWTLVIISRLCNIVTEHDIVIKPVPQYIDAF